MCQGCVDSGEISQGVYDEIEEFLHAWPKAEFGPAHIVLADCNVESEHIEWCLEHWDEYKRDHDGEELAMARAFLNLLLEIPEQDRVPVTVQD